MKYTFTRREGNSRLLIFFAGWGMDANVLAHISRNGYDIMVVWDYTSLHIDWSPTAPYSEICIFAWSMGVYAASLTTQALLPKVTLSVAINGTASPVDNRGGIPEDIFFGTLESLSERSVAKFNRRMCATRDDFTHFCDHAPGRSVESLRDELQAIADSMLLQPPVHSGWDLAVVGHDDRIFPARNQLWAWHRAGVRTEVVSAGHYFDFQQLVERFIIDKPLVRTRFEAGTATYRDHAGVQAEVVDLIMELARQNGVLGHLVRSRNRILEVGSGAGLLSLRIARYIHQATLEMWDLAAPMPANLPFNRRYRFDNCDAELAMRRCPTGSLDSVFSASTIQWFNSPPKFMAAMERALARGGYAVISSFVKGNLHQISDISGNSLPLLTPDQWRQLAEKHFNVLQLVTFERDLDFETPVEVLRHLKLTGVNAVSGSADATATARKIISRYPMMLDARYHLTYCPIIMILRKP